MRSITVANGSAGPTRVRRNAGSVAMKAAPIARKGAGGWWSEYASIQHMPGIGSACQMRSAAMRPCVNYRLAGSGFPGSPQRRCKGASMGVDAPSGYPGGNPRSAHRARPRAFLSRSSMSCREPVESNVAGIEPGALDPGTIPDQAADALQRYAPSEGLGAAQRLPRIAEQSSSMKNVSSHSGWVLSP